MADFDITKDPDLSAPAVEKPERSVLDALRNELKRVVRNEPLTLHVPARNGMSIKYDTNIESGTLQQWRKASYSKSMPDNFDGLKFASIVIANQATEITFEGEVIIDDSGDLLNFRNPRFIEMLGAVKAVEAVRKLYGIDGHIFTAADEILRASGYDSEGQDQKEDPTLLT